MTNNLSVIKSQIKYLYQTKPLIHIDLLFRNERKHLSNVSAKITAVYPNIFTVIIKEAGVNKKYNFQYADLLTHNIEIRELSKQE